MSQEEILVIGGGVIGICSAYYLSRAAKVIVIEKGEICSGCSYGNAGLLAPSHSIPLPAPGVMKKAVKWMSDPESPFYIRPRFDLELVSWLWKFGNACKDSLVRKNTPLLRDLARASIEMYRELASTSGADFSFRQDGLLTLFRSHAAYKAALREADLLDQVGVAPKVIKPADFSQMEPAVLPSVVGGLFFPQDGHLSPANFVNWLARSAEAMGATICTSTEVLKLETAGRRITTVKTTRGDFRPDQVVVAAGAWSPLLIRDLQVKLPIQAAKGYSITVKPEVGAPRIPLLFGEARVIATPMGETLRYAGTLELAGLNLSMNLRRLEAVRRACDGYISRIKDEKVVEIWRGLRPCTPDGLPIIGRSQQIENLIVATGHCMLGMSLGPVTGRLVSQLVFGETPLADLRPLRVERFA